MFKEIRKVFPTNENGRKKHLDTVPTKKEMKEEKEMEKQIDHLFEHAITPITFFDMATHTGTQYKISSIMSLPLEVQGRFGWDTVRNQNVYRSITNLDAHHFNRYNNIIQSNNIYGMIVDAMVNNYQIFAYQGPALDIIQLDGINIRNDIFDKFGYYVYNNVNGCMDDLHHYLDLTYSKDIFSISAVNEHMETDDRKIERTIAILNAISQQVNEMIVFTICYFTNGYLDKYITDMKDDEVSMVIQRIKSRYDINDNLKLKDRVGLRSFMSEAIREDLRVLMENNIVPIINHICDNSGITNYFIYKDMIRERQK